MEATSLSNTNSTKILELEDELSSALRDAVAAAAGDEIEVASFTEDEVLSLGALCSRLNVLVGIRDMTAWMEENEGGKQSSAWDIVSAIAERGRLGYKEEELVRYHCCLPYDAGELISGCFFFFRIHKDDRPGAQSIDYASFLESSAPEYRCGT